MGPTPEPKVSRNMEDNRLSRKSYLKCKSDRKEGAGGCEGGTKRHFFMIANLRIEAEAISACLSRANINHYHPAKRKMRVGKGQLVIGLKFSLSTKLSSTDL